MDIHTIATGRGDATFIIMPDGTTLMIDAGDNGKTKDKQHPDTTAFYRFADFENYYPNRKRQDAYLYERFLELGGKPEEEHPLSFVVEGSDYLREWFGNGVETRLSLKDIEPCHISFTIGDSGAEFIRNGSVELLTVEDLYRCMAEYGGSFEAFIQSTGKHYVEVQLWSDKYVK